MQLLCQSACYYFGFKLEMIWAIQWPPCNMVDLTEWQLDLLVKFRLCC